MDEELRDIVKRMMENGESDEMIQAVIARHNEKTTLKKKEETTTTLSEDSTSKSEDGTLAPLTHSDRINKVQKDMAEAALSGSLGETKEELGIYDMKPLPEGYEEQVDLTPYANHKRNTDKWVDDERARAEQAELENPSLISDETGAGGLGIQNKESIMDKASGDAEVLLGSVSSYNRKVTANHKVRDMIKAGQLSTIEEYLPTAIFSKDYERLENLSEDEATAYLNPFTKVGDTGKTIMEILKEDETIGSELTEAELWSVVRNNRKQTSIVEGEKERNKKIDEYFKQAEASGIPVKEVALRDLSSRIAETLSDADIQTMEAHDKVRETEAELDEMVKAGETGTTKYINKSRALNNLKSAIKKNVGHAWFDENGNVVNKKEESDPAITEEADEYTRKLQEMYDNNDLGSLQKVWMDLYSRKLYEGKLNEQRADKSSKLYGLILDPELNYQFNALSKFIATRRDPSKEQSDIIGSMVDGFVTTFTGDKRSYTSTPEVIQDLLPSLQKTALAREEDFKRAEGTTAEEVASMGGSVMATLTEFALIELATAGLGTEVGLARASARIRKMTEGGESAGFYGKVMDVVDKVMPAVVAEGKFNLAGMSIGTGTAELLAERLLVGSKLNAFLAKKMGPVGSALLKVPVKGAVIGTTETIGSMAGGDIDLSNMTDDAQKELLMNYAMGVVFGLFKKGRFDSKTSYENNLLKIKAIDAEAKYAKKIIENSEKIEQDAIKAEEKSKETVEKEGLESTEKEGVPVRGTQEVGVEAEEEVISKDKGDEAVDEIKEVFKKEQDKFHEASPHSWAVDKVSPESIDKSTVVEDNGTFAVVTDDGDIKGVFKSNVEGEAKKGTLPKVIEKAVESGGIKLDNFDGKLTKLYEDNGFRVVSRTPFSEEFAPEGWSKKEHGTPDIVAMVYDPDGSLNIKEKYFNDYDKAIEYRDSFVSDAKKNIVPVKKKPTKVQRDVKKDVDKKPKAKKKKLASVESETKGLTKAQQLEQGIKEERVATDIETRKKVSEVRVKSREALKTQRTSIVAKAKSKAVALKKYRSIAKKYVKDNMSNEFVSQASAAKITQLQNKIDGATSQRGVTKAVNDIDKIITEGDNKFLKSELDKALKKKYTKTEAGKTVGKTISPEANRRIKDIKDNSSKDIEEIGSMISDIEQGAEGRVLTDEELDAIVDLETAGKIGLIDQGLVDMSTVAATEITNDALSNIEALVSEGKSERKQQLKKQSEAYAKDADIARKDTDKLNKGEPLTKSQIDSLNNQKKKFFKRSIGAVENFMSDWTVNVALDIDGLIDKASKGSGEFLGSELGKITSDRLTKASREETSGVIEKKNLIEGEMKNIFGKRWKSAMRGNGIRSNYVLKSDGTAVEFSQNQMITIYNLLKNPSAKLELEAQGYGKEQIDSINEMMTEESKELADWLTDEFYRDYHPEINKVYIDIHRTDLGQESEYSGKIHREADSPEVNLYDSQQSFNQVVGDGSLKGRTVNFKDAESAEYGSPIIIVDAFESMFTYMSQMEHFKAYARPMKDIRKIFNDPTVKANIKRNNSGDVMMYIDHLLDVIAKKNSRGSTADKFVNALNSTFVFSKLALNRTIPLKQASSFISFTADIGPAKYAKYTAIALGQKKGLDLLTAVPSVILKADFNSTWKEMVDNSPYIKDRYDSKDFQKVIESYTNSAKKISSRTKAGSDIKASYNWLWEQSMSMIKGGDKRGVMGSIPVYLSHKAEYMKKNPKAPEQKAIDYALAKTEKSIDKSQQSKGASSKDYTQTSHPLMRILSTFLTSPKQYHRKSIQATRNLGRHAGRLFKDGPQPKGSMSKNIYQLAMFHSVLPMIYQYIASGLPGILSDWDEDDGDDLFRAGLFGNFNTLFIVGDVMSFGLDVLQEKPYASPRQSAITSQMYDFIGTYEKFKKAKTQESQNKYSKKLMIKGFEMFGVPATQIDRIRRDVESVTEDQEVREIILRVFGYSDYVIKGSKNKNKTKSKTKANNKHKFKSRSYKSRGYTPKR